MKGNYGAPATIVSDRLSSYLILFDSSKHIKVQSWFDETTNNLIESFFKRFKHKYKICHGLKVEASVQALLEGFFFFYNYIRPHSGLNNETPARVTGVKYSELQRVNLFLMQIKKKHFLRGRHLRLFVILFGLVLSYHFDDLK